ncbi:ABC transporter permease subunit [Paenibacillus qinlingensis]|uniref:Aldouronate transport system permease protein n=1 Tax=Paenibacillus qinlingensis TaxID=1837343 RepID=A0ABU1NXM5_9BACL|nr:ABC transporter permease subunit [Paenibacillus qinlingensis]MDR6552256.1 putative aldouronate transport system permease protein [Paenibacillus qinlingensis]
MKPATNDAMPQTLIRVPMAAVKRHKTWKKMKRFIPLYLLFLPVLAYYAIFHYAPMTGVIIAFKKYTFMDGIFGSEWAGLAHFKRFIENGDFWIIFRNTLLLAFYRLLFGFPAPILFALLINELRFTKWKRFFQTVSYLPHFVSWVVVYALLYNLFSESGLINLLLKSSVGHTFEFLSSTEYYRMMFVGSAIWKEIGWSAIIFLAALTRVDPDMLEASAIDGANRWQRLWHITLPSIRSVISIMFVLSLGGILSVSFEQTLVMINPQVAPVAEVIDYYVYRIGLLNTNNYSYATAVGLFRSAIALVLVLVANYVSKKIDEEGAIW